MTKGEENIVLNERDELIQTIEAQQQMIFEANKQIEAQQQEIDRLKKNLADWKYNAKCDADHIAVLMSDRDEQVERIINKIREERKSQDEKWGEQNHYPLMWFSIIGEEFGEMCHAFNEYSFDQNPNHLEDMQREAIQVAACCIAMIECLERQAEKGLIP